LFRRKLLKIAEINEHNIDPIFDSLEKVRTDEPVFAGNDRGLPRFVVVVVLGSI
jgi:hypothetical protein